MAVKEKKVGLADGESHELRRGGSVAFNHTLFPPPPLLPCTSLKMALNLKRLMGKQDLITV